jgi:hypothetical protein
VEITLADMAYNQTTFTFKTFKNFNRFNITDITANVKENVLLSQFPGHYRPFSPQVAGSNNPAIRALAERLRQNGKAYKVVITACMRKLLIILIIDNRGRLPFLNPS